MSREIDISATSSLFAAFERAVEKFKENPAVSCLGCTLTYDELADYVDAFASFLQHSLGLKKGDRFAIMLPNITQFPVALFAAQKIGVIPVLTNPLYTPREILHQIKDSGSRVIMTVNSFVQKLETIIDQTSIEHIVSTGFGDHLPRWKDLIVKTALRFQGYSSKTKLGFIQYKHALTIGAHKRAVAADLTHDDLCLLQYTGGTTGLSRGAMLTQKNILANMAQTSIWTDGELIAGKEVVLTALPVFHIFSLTVNLLTFISMGQHMILVPKPVPIKNTAKMFKKYDITVITGVTTLYNALNNSPDFQKMAPKTIKFAVEGGMAMQERVNQAWKAITHNTIIEGYGLTEASPVTHCNPLKGVIKSGSIGIPYPSTEAKIVNPDGVELPHGEVGELIIRGPQVMSGYWNQPEETKETLRDGWLWTGDMTKRDEDGYFFIMDRKKDMILVSGFNVFPNEIDMILTSHPKVKEAAVVGIPDSCCGETIKAYVVPSDSSLTIEELKRFCHDQLTGYKRPRFYEFIESLPKSTVGKPLRRKLRELHLAPRQD